MLLLLSGRGLWKCVIVAKTQGIVKLSLFGLVWHLWSLCGSGQVCVCDDPVQQIMIKASKMWKQGIKSSWQKSTFLISEIWKNDYFSPEYQAFYSFYSYLMPDRKRIRACPQWCEVQTYYLLKPFPPCPLFLQKGQGLLGLSRAPVALWLPHITCEAFA